MSFDYLDDLFGRDRKTGLKYAAVEERAARLIAGYVCGRISHEGMDAGLMAVREKMVELDDGVIDAEHPLWLSQFLAFKFRRWHDWRALVRARGKWPEKFADSEAKAMYADICAQDIDSEFMEACRYCMRELTAAGKRGY